MERRLWNTASSSGDTDANEPSTSIDTLSVVDVDGDAAVGVGGDDGGLVRPVDMALGSDTHDHGHSCADANGSTVSSLAYADDMFIASSRLDRTSGV